MFWFCDKLLKELCTYPSAFSDKQKTFIKESMSNVIPSFGDAFSFKTSDYYLIENHELEYMQSIIDCCRDKEKQERKINEKLLVNYRLAYKNNKIFNELGSTSIINIEKTNDVTYVRKTIRNDDCLKYIIQENKILDIILQSNYRDSFIYKTNDVFDGRSLLLECANDTLESYLTRNAQIKIEEQREIIIKLCFCIYNLHQLQILHRDLHPNNIFIVQKEDDIAIKLGDFGLSIRMADIQLERKNPRPSYGAIDYISPEQKDNLSNCTIYSEVFSIGRLINYIMTRKPKNNNHIFSYISTKCTNNNPASRYMSVMDVIKAIQNV